MAAAGATEREILDAFEAARKAADAAGAEEESPEAARCVDALRRLRGAPVTTSALVSTQVSHCRISTSTAAREGLGIEI
ncbi:hypothetical protein GUJ93_ZPchr0013g34923 [Zizania palustris]|uniref:Uncharacterized protein n=1 Tax=Zizania palustris TaxID=103762 RepID=A0A8J5WZE5_ZIZPA|nr:hypothetical protein GUJ93_ZPchr0013g34923 [Zizania palustris]